MTCWLQELPAPWQGWGVLAPHLPKGWGPSRAAPLGGSQDADPALLPKARLTPLRSNPPMAGAGRSLPHQTVPRTRGFSSEHNTGQLIRKPLKCSYPLSQILGLLVQALEQLTPGSDHTLGTSPSGREAPALYYGSTQGIVTSWPPKGLVPAS